jgi:hypothetical protein
MSNWRAAQQPSFDFMSEERSSATSMLSRSVALLTGAYSLAVPLVITPIAAFRLLGAIHGHSI